MKSSGPIIGPFIESSAHVDYVHSQHFIDNNCLGPPIVTKAQRNGTFDMLAVTNYIQQGRADVLEMTSAPEKLVTPSAAPIFVSEMDFKRSLSAQAPKQHGSWTSHA
jgi:hypothetical protein